MKPIIDINSITTDAMNAARKDLVARLAAAYQEPLRKALEDTLLAAVATDATIEEATRQAVAAADATIASIGSARPSPVPQNIVLPPAPYVAAIPMPTQPGEPPKAPSPPLAPGFRTPLPFPPMASNGGAGSGSPASIPGLPPPPPAVPPRAPSTAEPAPVPAQPETNKAASTYPQPFVAGRDPYVPNSAEEKAWRSYLRQMNCSEQDLCVRAFYFKFPDWFTQPSAVFHAIARAIPEREAEALSVMDIADRARVPCRHVLYALSWTASLMRNCWRTTKTLPALVWLPLPSADDPTQDQLRSVIEAWRTTPVPVDPAPEPDKNMT